MLLSGRAGTKGVLMVVILAEVFLRLVALVNECPYTNRCYNKIDY